MPHTRNNTGHRPGITRTLITSAVAGTVMSAFAAVTPSVGSAQQAAQLDPRWQPWIGCWQSPAVQSPRGASRATSGAAPAPLVCITPAAGGAASSSAVDVATVADGKIVAKHRIDASGQKQRLTSDDCTGVESAEWSANGHRVYMRSEYTCPGGITRTSTGVFAMSPTGGWVDVEGVNTGDGGGVRTLRYTDAGAPASLPREIAVALGGHTLSVRTARAAAAAPLTTQDVVEASRKLDPAVVEAWLMDRGQRFNVDARELVALADAGVPGNVTDAMIALAYPREFTVAGSADVGAGAADAGVIETTRAGGSAAYTPGGRDIQVYMTPSYLPLGYAPYGYSMYGYSPYGGYGYSPYAGYGYSPYAGYGYYGSPYGGWYGNRAPVIIVRKGDEAALRSGQVVKGRGYTRTAPGSAGSTAHPRPRYAPPPSNTNNTNTNSGSAGNSTGSSTNNAPPPPPRTAHPRP